VVGLVVEHVLQQIPQLALVFVTSNVAAT